jgi:hypothetical protein
MADDIDWEEKMRRREIQIFATRTFAGEKPSGVRFDVCIESEAVQHQCREMTDGTEKLDRRSINRIVKQLEKRLPEILQKAIYSEIWDQIDKER